LGIPYLRQGLALNPGLQGALGKVDFFLAAFTDMFLFELIGEDFLFHSAVGAFADKRLQVFLGLKSGAVHGCGHDLPPFNSLIQK
jgi:hypothetical protein